MEINQVQELLNVQTITKSMLHFGLYLPRNCFIKLYDNLAVKMDNGKYFICDDSYKARKLLSQNESKYGLLPYTTINDSIVTFIDALLPEYDKKVLITDNDYDMRECNIHVYNLLHCPYCTTKSIDKCHLEIHIKTHENDGLRGSRGERKVMSILKNLGIYYIYDKSYCDLNGTKNAIRFDFRIPLAGGHNLFIEVDEEHHRRPVAYGGMKHYDEAIRNHKSTQLHDGIKNQFIIERGDSLLRLPDNQINTFLERIDSFILRNSKLLIPGSDDKNQNTYELLNSKMSTDEKMEFML